MTTDQDLKKFNSQGLAFVDAGWEEAAILEEIETVYRPDSWGLNASNVLLEIGAHVGEVAMYCAKKFGCHVFTFEPSPRNFEKLHKNVIANHLKKLISINNLAVTVDGRDIHMAMPANGGAHNIYGQSTDPSIPSERLKYIVSGLKDAGWNIQVLLMDCEKAEFEILEGDISYLKGISVFAGEFHSRQPGDIEALLTHVREVIPSADPYMHYPKQFGRLLPEIFTQIYQKSLWKSRESRSGRGSEMKNTREIRRWLPELIAKKQIRSILDVGCGDFNWLRMLKFTRLKINYTGCDIVPELIAANCQQYENKWVHFLLVDATKDQLPTADLAICRDILYHLSFENIFRVIRNIRASGVKYLLITNHPGKSHNEDIYDGSYRRLNYSLAPFNFPAPSDVFEDNQISGETMQLYRSEDLEAVC